MKYYIDTEFLEGTQKEQFPISLFRKQTPNTIDLISIGIVAEDEREYYAISKDFNLKEAWNRFQLDEVYGDMRNTFPNGLKVYWIRENVLRPIFEELVVKEYKELQDKEKFDEMAYNQTFGIWFFDYGNFKRIIKKYGKPNKQIAQEIKEFVYPLEQWRDLHQGSFLDGRHGLCLSLGVHAHVDDLLEYSVPQIESPKFYAYYADYDWVAFCWLFGKMMELPKGFPMYCRDLKQMLDEKEDSLRNKNGKVELVSEIIPEHGCAMSAEFNSIKEFGNYPTQENEHNALDDARWNKKLHEFLNKV